MHGTNDPSSIGKNASHGCIRHHNDAIMKMYPYLKVGTPVYITSKYEPSRILQELDFQR